MSLLAEFARVTRRNQCPICARPDWCIVSREVQALGLPVDPVRRLGVGFASVECLETLRVGGTLCTSLEALQRLFEALSEEGAK